MNTDEDDRTVEELRDELRERDLKVSGTKHELLARLADDERGTDDDARDGDHGADTDASRGSASMRDVLVRIQQELRDVTGLPVERTSGLDRDDGGWQARVEVVEVSRVPPSTDVLATYEVRADADGSLTSFDRVQRYRRSEAIH